MTLDKERLPASTLPDRAEFDIGFPRDAGMRPLRQGQLQRKKPVASAERTMNDTTYGPFI
jgi:hypothetical protein